MRVPIERYLDGTASRVYSYVVAVPFSPIDLDLGRLARGEWNASSDRFRVWHMPGDARKGLPQLCYVIVRKFDPQAGVLTFLHIVVNLDAQGEDSSRNFTIGVLSNDDVRSRAALGAVIGIPPAFHRRSELLVIERRWRTDASAVLRFAANAQSAMSKPGPGETGFNIRLELEPGIVEELRRNMGAWWPSLKPRDAASSRSHGEPGSSELSPPARSA